MKKTKTAELAELQASLRKPAPAAAPGRWKQPGREGKVAAEFWIDPAVRVLLKTLAARESTTMQALLTEATGMLLRDRGMPAP